jgi:hypothetical protein
LDELKLDRVPNLHAPPLSTIQDVIAFKGHMNVLGLHRTTIEITRDEEISHRADCIIGVRAEKACKDLSTPLKIHIRAGGSLTFRIDVGGLSFTFSGRGHPSLDLSHDRELVLRKSEFTSPRTAAIACTSAAMDIPRKIIDRLGNSDTSGTLSIAASDSTDKSSS